MHVAGGDAAILLLELHFLYFSYYIHLLRRHAYLLGTCLLFQLHGGVLLHWRREYLYYTLYPLIHKLNPPALADVNMPHLVHGFSLA